MRFELFQDDREQWRWRLRDDHGRVIAQSPEAYANKKHAYADIDCILELTKADIIDVRE